MWCSPPKGPSSHACCSFALSLTNRLLCVHCFLLLFFLFLMLFVFASFLLLLEALFYILVIVTKAPFAS